jgi:hypothetical protein
VNWPPDGKDRARQRPRQERAMLPRLTVWLRDRLGFRARRSYEVAVVHQWLLLTLHRFGECGFAMLEAELLAIRGASTALVVEALLELEGLGLVSHAAAAGLMAQERRFVLTATGRRLIPFIPRTPRSPTVFYA